MKAKIFVLVLLVAFLSLAAGSCRVVTGPFPTPLPEDRTGGWYCTMTVNPDGTAQDRCGPWVGGYDMLPEDGGARPRFPR